MNNLTLKDLLDRIQKQQFKIPEFQRDFIWKPINTANLIDSLFNKYPIGNFLLLSCENELELSSFNLQVNEKIFNIKNERDKNNSYYVLDGQQRITSLARAFLDSDDDNIYCINLEEFYKLIYKKEDFGTQELMYVHPKKNKYSLDIINKKNKFKYLPLFETLSENSLSRTYKIKEFAANNLNLINDDNICIDFLTKCAERFADLFNYLIPIQLLDSNTTTESIVRIFETINNTGIKLNVFDLMVAKTFRKESIHGLDFNLKYKVDTIKESYKSLENLTGESILLAILYSQQLLKGDYIISTKTKILKLDYKAINDSIDDIIKSFYNVENWLLENKLNTEKTPINIKIMLAVSDYLYKIMSDIKINDRIKQLILFRSYSDSLYNRELINEDLLLFKKNNQETNFNFKLKLQNIILFNEITKEDIIKINKKNKSFIPFLSIINDKINNDIYNIELKYPKIEYHHILPESYINKKYGQKSNISEKYKDSLCNFSITTPETNKKISDKYPSQYFYDIINEINNKEILIQIFKDNIIPIDIEKDNIKKIFSVEEEEIEFLNKRAEIIANIINKYYYEFKI